jgi:pimeloyl-ACP methyl ester carboxylesterase
VASFTIQSIIKEIPMPRFTWNDHTLFYRERGQGPLLLILPGNTASSACHEGELAYFSDHPGDGHRAVALDFLGTGRSDRVEAWADDWWAQGARQARALIDHLGYDTCAVMGTSGGAIAALWMAVLFPDAVRGVIADSCVQHFTEAMLRDNIMAARARRTPGQVAFWQHAHGEDWAQVVDADTALIRRFVARGGTWLESRLEEIEAPVLFTASARDAMLPAVRAEVMAMSAQIPDSRVYLHSEGDHPLMWTQPAAFRHQADFFLAGIRD